MKRVCLVAGGTGGHIFPAIAFGKWITKHQEEVKVSFVCGSRPLEQEIYEASHITPYYLPTSGSPLGIRSLSGKIRRLKEFGLSFISFKKLLRNCHVDACVLFGGYVSFIPLMVCHLTSVPVFVHEQNSVAGKVTRLSSRLGKKVASGWEVCTPLSPDAFHWTGVPVRGFSLREPKEAWELMALGKKLPEKKIIGVLGGSLMSQRLIQLMGPMLRAQEMRNFFFLFLGDSQLADIAREFHGSPENISVIGKQWDMSNFYSVVDAVVTRGGASTLSELATLGIPAVVVPWQEAADNHQERNALCFIEHNDGAIWHENDSPKAFQECILKILRNTQRPPRSISKGDESESLWRLISSSIGREIL